MSKKQVDQSVDQEIESVVSNPTDNTFNKLLQEPSAHKEPSANKEPSAHKEPSANKEQKQQNGLHTGYIAEIDDQGYPLVMIDGQQATAIKAQFLCPPEQLTPNAQCALMYQEGLQNMPVIMGVFQNPIIALSGDGFTQTPASNGEKQTHKKIEANQSIMISCGKASIALSQDGRVEIRGTSVVQHSTGLNRIRGASVKIN